MLAALWPDWPQFVAGSLTVPRCTAAVCVEYVARLPSLGSDAVICPQGSEPEQLRRQPACDMGQQVGDALGQSTVRPQPVHPLFARACAWTYPSCFGLAEGIVRSWHSVHSECLFVAIAAGRCMATSSQAAYPRAGARMAVFRTSARCAP